jgi:hypothetical protein
MLLHFVGCVSMDIPDGGDYPTPRAAWRLPAVQLNVAKKLRVETTGHTILTLMNVIFTFKSDVSLKIP